ncbi:quinol monooxygenase YgiN [Cupriavidus alkaliphilus]|nr:quinol monooxygenase YgiN [Cupriavidus alkaliphilus]
MPEPAWGFGPVPHESPYSNRQRLMIHEIVQITIKPGMEAQFEASVARARPLFLDSKGCHGVNLQRSIEQPSHYTLVVAWETLEDHTVHFRQSEAFHQWRGLVGDCFAAPPAIHHVNTVL